MMHSEYTLEQEFQLATNSTTGARKFTWATNNTSGTPLDGRRFAVGYYSCPFQAGNRLHHFMNALVWAVVTNRTILWKYYDMETCQRVGRNYDRSICFKTGTQESCNGVLPLRDWIPSYDKWAPLLGLSYPSEVSFWSTHSPISASNSSKAFKVRKKRDEKAARIASEPSPIDLSTEYLLDFGQLLGNEAAILESERNREYLLHSINSRTTAERLLSASNKFLYGLLFERLFSFNDGLVRAVHLAPNTTLGVRSVAVHSRHSNESDDGTNTDREIDCLKKVLPRSNHPCVVYIMSDRPASIERIKNAAQGMNCTPFLPQHSKGLSFRKEHVSLRLDVIPKVSPYKSSEPIHFLFFFFLNTSILASLGTLCWSWIFPGFSCRLAGTAWHRGQSAFLDDAARGANHISQKGRGGCEQRNLIGALASVSVLVISRFHNHFVSAILLMLPLVPSVSASRALKSFSCFYLLL